MEERKRLPSVNEAMEQAIQARYFEVRRTKVLDNKGYVEAVNRFDDAVRKVLSPEQQEEIYREIICASTDFASIEAKIMYRQGLRDGMALRPAWGGARNG